MANSYRIYLWQKQRGKCHYCRIQMTKHPNGKYFVTEDHIIPKSRGGSRELTNLVGACHTCNNMRGTIDYKHFKDFIEVHGNKQPIRDVMSALTAEQYEARKAMYDGVRAGSYMTHVPPWQRQAPPPLFHEKHQEPPKKKPYVWEPKPKPYRRDFLHLTRRNLESIMNGIPYWKQRQYLNEGQDNAGRYLSNRFG